MLFGVSDSGRIKGQDISDKTKRDIVEAIRRIEPTAPIEISYVSVLNTDKFVVALKAEELSYLRPFTYKSRAYQRIESVTTAMPQEMYNQLLMQRGGAYCWEAMTNVNLKIENLDENAIMGAVRAGIRSGRLPEATIREEIPAILVGENRVIESTSAPLFRVRHTKKILH